jgi:hypothetical protein
MEIAGNNGCVGGDEYLSIERAGAGGSGRKDRWSEGG